MKTEIRRRIFDGRDLQDVWFLPETRARTALFLLHGQGDHAERYGGLFEILTARGIAGLVTDLPGHGRSEGSRGHVPGRDFVHKFVAAGFREVADRFPEVPLGFGAHSAGGLLGLDWLATRGSVSSPPLRFAWIDAPLVRPDHGRPAWLPTVAKIAARLAPRMTISTGVTREKCRTSPPPEAVDAPATPWQGHDRVSLAWAVELVAIARTLPARLERIPKELPILLTQGTDDPVCPARFARSLFEALPSADKRFVSIENARHEPFADEHLPELTAALSTWLEAHL